jgi:hypothetical protein
VTGVATPTDQKTSPLIKLLQIAVMISGSVHGAGKPINIVAFKAPPMIGSAPADLMMSSVASVAAHPQDEYPNATALADYRSALDGGVHTRLSRQHVRYCAQHHRS